MELAIAWAQIVLGVGGNTLCLVLWIKNKIGDRAMIGLTLSLSWMGMWFSGITSLLEAK